MKSTILSASAASRVTAAFGRIRVDTLATLGPGAMGDAAGPDMADIEGAGTAGQAMAASVTTGDIVLPLVAASATTSTTSNGGKISTLGGAAYGTCTAPSPVVRSCQAHEPGFGPSLQLRPGLLWASSPPAR